MPYWSINMPKIRPRMKLSSDEEVFLRHWMYDEWHYRDGPGPAKRLQLQHQVISADLATLIAAAIPEPAEQEAAGIGPPPADPPKWIWADVTLRSRVEEARSVLAEFAESAAAQSSQPNDVDRVARR